MTLTATEARQRLFPLIAEVNEDRQAVRITSKQGNAVLVAEADYDSLLETAYLFRSPANARRLLAADAALRAGEGVAVELDRG
ncbi:MAG: type II toxin-antitoxin system prevent-host-death family antitoxin [Propionibacteriaceae bacterium]|nr:type II toxin-antitoxin system prevent-host-death family antitoxin [Propionibacteriaceae bacterium]